MLVALRTPTDAVIDLEGGIHPHSAFTVAKAGCTALLSLFKGVAPTARTQDWQVHVWSRPQTVQRCWRLVIHFGDPGKSPSSQRWNWAEPEAWT